MTAERWSLAASLGIGERPELVAIVGGGGKTSLMFALAAELPGRVVMTTTTRIFAAQIKRAPAVVYESDLSPLGDALDAHGHCLVIGRVAGEKALGVDPELPAQLLARPDVDYVLVEADGSRMRPVKAPAEHEPAIPPGTTLLVPMAGVDALEGVIEEVAHRPEIINYELGIRNEEQVGQLSGVKSRLMLDGRLTPAGLARVLAHPHGGLKGALDTARIVHLLNKVETNTRLAAARETAQWLLGEPRIDRVVLGALQSPEPVREVRRRVTAVVLAAGQSSRMGTNKLLLPWGEATVLERTLGNIAVSAVTDVVIVVGHERHLTEPIAARYGKTITNLNYAKGMLSSVQAAVDLMPASTEATLIVLGDQPMVGRAIIDELLTAYAAGPHGLVAPIYRGRRGNPVLIDRCYFAELLALPPDEAPRALLRQHRDDLCLLEVESDAILQDLDRPDDYARLRPE